MKFERLTFNQNVIKFIQKVSVCFKIVTILLEASIFLC